MREYKRLNPPIYYRDVQKITSDFLRSETRGFSYAAINGLHDLLMTYLKGVPEYSFVESEDAVRDLSKYAKNLFDLASKKVLEEGRDSIFISKNGQILDGSSAAGSSAAEEMGAHSSTASGLYDLTQNPDGLSETETSIESGGMSSDGQASNAPSELNMNSSDEGWSSSCAKSEKNGELLSDRPSSSRAGSGVIGAFDSQTEQRYASEDERRQNQRYSSEYQEKVSRTGDGNSELDSDKKLSGVILEPQQGDMGDINLPPIILDISEDRTAKAAPNEAPHQGRLGASSPSSIARPLSEGANATGTISYQEVKYFVSLKAKARKALQKMTGTYTDFKGNRRNKNLIVRNLLSKKYSKIPTSFKKQRGRAAVLFLPDTSPSCASFSRHSLEVVKAVRELGTPGLDILSVSHFNGTPEKLVINGKPLSLSSILPRRYKRSKLFYDKLIGQYNVNYIVILGDWDGVLTFCETAEHARIRLVYWLDGSRYGHDSSNSLGTFDFVKSQKYFKDRLRHSYKEESRHLLQKGLYVSNLGNASNFVKALVKIQEKYSGRIKNAAKS